MPNVNPINLRISNENFGDFVMIYEFFNNFWSQLDAGSYFPQGMSVELLERCLVDEEVTGINTFKFCFLFDFNLILKILETP